MREQQLGISRWARTDSSRLPSCENLALVHETCCAWERGRASYNVCQQQCCSSPCQWSGSYDSIKAASPCHCVSLEELLSVLSKTHVSCGVPAVKHCRRECFCDPATLCCWHLMRAVLFRESCSTFGGGPENNKWLVRVCLHLWSDEVTAADAMECLPYHPACLYCTPAARCHQKVAFSMQCLLHQHWQEDQHQEQCLTIPAPQPFLVEADQVQFLP